MVQESRRRLVPGWARCLRTDLVASRVGAAGCGRSFRRFRVWLTFGTCRSLRAEFVVSILNRILIPRCSTEGARNDTYCLVRTSGLLKNSHQRDLLLGVQYPNCNAKMRGKCISKKRQNASWKARSQGGETGLSLGERST